MPTSGWLTSGVTNSPESLPALVTVKVEPRSSSGASLPARARSASASTSERSSSTAALRAAAHDGHDEPLVGLHGDAEVVAVEVDDLVALEARVQLRELLQGERGRAQHEREELFQVDVREVAFLDVGDGRHLAVRPRQVLDDLAPHAPHRLAPALGRRPGTARPGNSAHVVGADPSAGPARGDRREVDAELLREPPHERRRLHVPAGRVRARHGRGQTHGHVRSGHRRRRDGRFARVAADHDEHGPDRDDVALRDPDARDEAGGRRRDLDRRLVGLDLDERLVLRDLVPLRDEPAGDLPFGQSLAEIRQLELVPHGVAGYLRGRPTHEPAGTSRTRKPSPARRSDTACSLPSSSAATSRGT